MGPKTTTSPSTSASISNPQRTKSEEDYPLSCFVETHGVITTTMNNIPNHRITSVLGTIYGITVRSRNWGVDITAFFRSAIGGEIRYITSLMYDARTAAVERLVGECLGRGGNAVVGLRFDCGEVHTFAQVCAYGTACVVERIEENEGLASSKGVGEEDDGMGDPTLL